MKYLSTLLFLLLALTAVKAQDYTTQNGAGQDFWTDSDSWDNGVPSCGGSPITIEINRDVIIRNTVVSLNCEVHITITSSGRIRFGNNGTTTGLQLGAGSTITVEAGGSVVTNTNGGDHANNSITINGSEIWNGDGNNDFTEDVDLTYEEEDTLPIELSSFSAKSSHEGVALSWTTSAEINNEYFTVLRSSDGVNFGEIGRLEGAGNSTGENNYSFYDQKPLAGTSYYRLRQTDYDGKFEEFKIVSVEVGELITSQIEIYPNPCVEKLICRGVSTPGELRVLDEYGKDMTQYVLITAGYTNQLEIDVTRLQGGAVYLLKTSREYVRFVKN